MRNPLKKAFKYYGEARQRAQRRKSAWNALLLPFCLCAGFGIWCVFFGFVWRFHVLLFPAHQLKDFWGAGISFGSFVPSFLMVASIMPGAFVLGFILGNLLFWLIPPARRAFEKEASAYPNTNFKETMNNLFRFAFWTLIPGFLAALTSAYFLKSLK